MTHDVERVLADVDADHGDRCVEFLRHGVLLVLSAPLPASHAGRAGARPDHPISGSRTRCHSITSSARSKTEIGRRSPSALGVLRLINYLECCRTLDWKDRWAQTL